MAIELGSAIQIELVKMPIRQAARKTLVRLFRKDPKIVRHHRLQHAKRPSQEFWMRGGKFWHHQMESKPSFELKVGLKHQIRATPDVVRDLKSVEQWVKVG